MVQTNKVTPIKEKTLESSRATYDQLFGDVERYIGYKLKWRGIHTLTYKLIEDNLDDALVADIGCGYGRFCLLAAQKARKVVGIEMTAGAVNVARVLTQAAGMGDRIEIIQSTAEDYTANDGQFDYVVLGGVLEHLMDPSSIIDKIHKMLKPGGVLISNSPSESNFRGTVSTAFWKLFNFPMTLSDVRVVTKSDMQELADQYGFQFEKSVGVAYSRGWGKVAANDLPQRFENVLQDVFDEVKDIQINQDDFKSWVRQRTNENEVLIQDWVQRDILRSIPSRPNIPLNEDIIQGAGLPLEAINEFMAPDFSMDPYYSDVEPYNHMGGQTIYFLRKK